MGERLRKSLESAPVVRFGEYQYFVHPLTDGIPAIEPAVVREVVAEVRALVDWRGVTRIVTPEAMGIPVGMALALDTGIALTVIRKRKYGLPGEIAIDQTTGYSKGALYVNGLAKGNRVVFVDDVISTGGTLGPILAAFREHGIEVADIVVLVEKGEGRSLAEKEHGVHIKTLARIEVADGRVVVGP